MPADERRSQPVPRPRAAQPVGLLDEDRMHREADVLSPLRRRRRRAPPGRVVRCRRAADGRPGPGRVDRWAVVIMDEPTSSLEPREVDRCSRTIRRLHAAGVAIVYVSHNGSTRSTEISDRSRSCATGAGRAPATIADIDRARGDRDDARPRRRRSPLGGTHQLHAAIRCIGADAVLDAVGLGRRHQLHDVLSTVRTGEVVGLAGLLGAGRSETIKAICGAYHLDRGSVPGRGGQVRTGSSGRSHRGRHRRCCPRTARPRASSAGLSVRDNIVLRRPPG